MLVEYLKTQRVSCGIYSCADQKISHVKTCVAKYLTGDRGVSIMVGCVQRTNKPIQSNVV